MWIIVGGPLVATVCATVPATDSDGHTYVCNGELWTVSYVQMIPSYLIGVSVPIDAEMTH
jgi:hypothetical protein